MPMAGPLIVSEILVGGMDVGGGIPAHPVTAVGRSGLSEYTILPRQKATSSEARDRNWQSETDR
jgi:hypothetical protein